jgi:SAM-dependent methyltransferase
MDSIANDFIGGIRLPNGTITQGKRSGRSLRRRNAVVACSFELAGMRVLDVGCADGLHSMYMAASAKEVWGIDHRASEIEKGNATAKALGIGNVSLRFGDVRDPALFKGVEKFDLAIAWGFLHRIGDIFGLLYSLAPMADAISLEWRTPIVPLLSSLSIAYHPPGNRPLDPMNIRAAGDHDPANDREKIEGNTAFWEPTPGAVKVITQRLGFVHATLIGYGERLESERKALTRHWTRHLQRANEGKERLDRLPRERVHMLFEKKQGLIAIKDLSTAGERLPPWDVALHDAVARQTTHNG